MKIVWTPLAQDDLATIFDYILADNPPAAVQGVDRIEEAAGSLAEFPYKGRPGAYSDARELVIPGLPYIVFYKIVANIHYITNVIHGVRNRQHD